EHHPAIAHPLGLRLGDEILARHRPSDRQPKISLELRRQLVLTAIAFGDQVQLSKLFDQKIGTPGLRQAKQSDWKLLDAGRKPARLGVHQAPCSQAALLARDALKARKPALEPIKDPQIELFKASEDCGLALGTAALALSGGACLRLRIDN